MIDNPADLPMFDVLLRTPDPTSHITHGCFSWSQAEAIISALRAADLLSDPFGPDISPLHPRPFVLVRDEDVTGVSGTGIVASGVQFHDGPVALRWHGDWPTSVVFHERGIESVQHVHGHNGRTRIEWT